MFTPDRSLPASADLRAASSLARLAWLKVTEPDRATCAGGLAPAAGVAPLGLLEQAAVISASKMTAQAATVRDLVLRIIVDRPSEGSALFVFRLVFFIVLLVRYRPCARRWYAWFQRSSLVNWRTVVSASMTRSSTESISARSTSSSEIGRAHV